MLYMSNFLECIVHNENQYTMQCICTINTVINKYLNSLTHILQQVNALEITLDKQLIAAAGKYLRKKSLTLCMSKFKSSIFKSKIIVSMVHAYLMQQNNRRFKNDLFINHKYF
jgi:hypothetical protein